MKKNAFLAPIAVVIVALALVLVGCGSTADDEKAIRLAADEALSTIKNGDDLIADEIDDESFDQLGIDVNEFSSAIMDGFEYEIGEVTVDKDAGTATAQVSVTSKSLSDIMSTFSSLISNADTSEITSEDDAYKLSGKLAMQAVEETEPTTKDLTLDFTRGSDGTWAATSDSSTQFGQDIFA